MMRSGSLRWQLFGSYFILLVVTLGVGAGVLLFALSSRPEPSLVGYQRLVQIARTLISELGRRNFERLTFSQLHEQADIYGVRVMVVRWSSRVLVYDSDDILTASDIVNLTVDPDYRATGGGGPQLADRVFGSITDPDSTEWLYIGIRTGPIRDLALVLAERRSTRTLQESLAEFSGSLAGPILQAALFGLGVAFVLAAVISGQLIKQLAALGEAARAVARGDYSHHVPHLEGPSEVREVAQAFNTMVREVQTTQQSQRDFLANVGHDLKTPLTSIQGYAQAIIDNAIDHPVHAAEVIYSEAARLSRMVNALTDLARLQSGRLALNIARVDVGELVCALVQRLEMMARHKDITIHVVQPPHPPLVIHADGDRLAQVITNLLSNAVKFTPVGGSITVHLRPLDTGVEISVKDTGIGIPPEELERVFERFYQVDKARGPQRGTGLGLAIAREIVLAHGGRIHADSTGEGHGSRFVVWLPATPP